MKQTLLFFALFFTIGYCNAQLSCDGCNDNGDISFIELIPGGSVFEASPAQAYFWEICDGTKIITSGNSSQQVTVECNLAVWYILKLTRFVDGECIESCLEFNCQ